MFYGGTKRNYKHGIGLVIGKDILNLRPNKIDWTKENATEMFNKMVIKEKSK